MFKLQLIVWIYHPFQFTIRHISLMIFCFSLKGAKRYCASVMPQSSIVQFCFVVWQPCSESFRRQTNIKISWQLGNLYRKTWLVRIVYITCLAPSVSKSNFSSWRRFCLFNSVLCSSFRIDRSLSTSLHFFKTSLYKIKTKSQLLSVVDMQNNLRMLVLILLLDVTR